MQTVTRISKSAKLTGRKWSDLTALAKALAVVRSYVWSKYGSINGVEKSKFDIQNEARPMFKNLNVESHILGATILDAAKDIARNREAAKAEVVKRIFRRHADSKMRIKLCVLLKIDVPRVGQKSWTDNKYLRRQMRKYLHRGHSRCVNQIVVPVDCYESFRVNGRGFINMCGPIIERKGRSQRGVSRYIAIPLSTNSSIRGQIKIVLRNGEAEIHYGLKMLEMESCGSGVVGVDKGYTEVFVDSDGRSHGEDFGTLMVSESDFLKTKYQRRGKIEAIARRSNPKKKAQIEKNNLGRKKLDARKCTKHAALSTLIHQAVHGVISKAKIVVVEDLTKNFSTKYRGPNWNRRLSVWAKGKIAKALENVATRRCASVKLVNAAYTSQICCDCGCFGKRSGDRFYCEVCGDVKQSDHVSARNILARLNDPEIKLYTPYRKVKEILLERSSSRLRLSNQDSSCAEMYPNKPTALAVAALAESEVPPCLIRSK